MRVLISDLSSLYWRVWFGAAGKPANHAYEVVIGEIRKQASRFDRVAIACDSGRCFRHDLYAGYKANREDKDPAALDQLARVVETLKRDGFPVWAAPGFEADDIVASFVAWSLKTPGVSHVTIASADKDLAALVGPRVVQVTPSATYDEAGVLEKFRVSPRQIPDWLAIVGDSSDNVPGAVGVGPVNASKLLAAHKNLDGIWKALGVEEGPDGGPIVKPPKIRAALFAAEASVMLSKKLVELRTDVPLDFATVLAERVQKPLVTPPRDAGDAWEPEDDSDGAASCEAPDCNDTAYDGETYCERHAAEVAAAAAKAVSDALPTGAHAKAFNELKPTEETFAAIEKAAGPEAAAWGRKFEAAAEIVEITKGSLGLYTKAGDDLDITPTVEPKSLGGSPNGSAARSTTDGGLTAAETVSAPRESAPEGSGGRGAFATFTPEGVERRASDVAASPPHAPASPGSVEANPGASASGPPREKPKAAEPSTALAVFDRNDPRWAMALEPRDSRGAVALAAHMFNSRLFKAYGNEDAVLAVILMGRSRGLDAMTALSGMHIIEGRPTLSAQTMVALVMRSGFAHFFQCVKTTHEVAVYKTHRKGNPEPIEYEFTIQDAHRQKLVRPGGNWEKNPRAMLRARCSSELARLEYPDVVGNIYTPEEMRGGEHDDEVLEGELVERGAA